MSPEKRKKFHILWLELKKQLRFFDGIIIVSLVLLSFLPYVVFAMSGQTNNLDPSQTIAIVSIDGKEVERFTLSETAEHQEKTYHPKNKQYNIIEIRGKKIRVKEDNSPDQIAVNTGWISRPGETSICLPHRFVIEIKGMPQTNEDDLIITY